VRSGGRVRSYFMRVSLLVTGGCVVVRGRCVRSRRSGKAGVRHPQTGDGITRGRKPDASSGRSRLCILNSSRGRFNRNGCHASGFVRRRRVATRRFGSKADIASRYPKYDCDIASKHNLSGVQRVKNFALRPAESRQD